MIRDTTPPESEIASTDARSVLEIKFYETRSTARRLRDCIKQARRYFMRREPQYARSHIAHAKQLHARLAAELADVEASLDALETE
jgi:hypothetical protein